MKKLLIASTILALSGAGYASAPGVYFGGQVGYANTGMKSLLKDAGFTSTKSDDLGGRVFVGYQFNPYLGVETGYTIYSETKAKLYIPSLANFGVKVKQQAVDLVGLAIYPVQEDFSVYAKAGAAYVMSKIDGKGSFEGMAMNGDFTENQYRFIGGVGAAYNINNNLTANVEYTIIPKRGNDFKTINSVLVGFAYKIST